MGSLGEIRRHIPPKRLMGWNLTEQPGKRHRYPDAIPRKLFLVTVQESKQKREIRAEIRVENNTGHDQSSRISVFCCLLKTLALFCMEQWDDLFIGGQADL